MFQRGTLAAFLTLAACTVTPDRDQNESEIEAEPSYPVKLGMSSAEVVSAMGQPDRIENFGNNRKGYFYYPVVDRDQGLKILFDSRDAVERVVYGDSLSVP